MRGEWIKNFMEGNTVAEVNQIQYRVKSGRVQCKLIMSANWFPTSVKDFKSVLTNSEVRILEA